MYAVLKTGGKQYRVSENDIIIVEKLSGEAGSTIDLDEILMIGEGSNTTVGTPVIDGARVAAEVLEQKRGKKITVFKKKRRKNYRRTIGHRQELTVLRITDILTSGEKKRASKKTTAKTSKTDAAKPAEKLDKTAISKNKEKIEKSAAKKKSQVKSEAKTAKAEVEKPAKESAGSKSAKKPAASNKKRSKED